MNIRKWVVPVVLMVVLSVMLVSQGSTRQLEHKFTTVVLAHDNDITGLIPFEHANMSSGRIEDVLYNRLFDYDEDMNIVPVLAEHYEMINDDKTLRIKIREGVRFHNGDELTAEDIAFGFQHWRDARVKAHMIDAMDTTEVLDKYTLDVHLKYPYSPLLGNIVAGFSAVSKKAITEDPDYKNNPVGTGPYKFVEWKPSERVVVEAFDDYFLGRPEVDQLVYVPVVETTNRTMGLEARDIHISYDIDPVDKGIIHSRRGLDYDEMPGTRISYVIINTQREMLNDVRVRNALALAIDREGIISAVLMGAGELAQTPVPQQVFGYSGEVEPIVQNMEKARELLEEAGIEQGTRLSLLTADRGENLSIAQIIQANLRDIGIDLVIDIVEWGTYLEYSALGRHDIALGGWSTGTGDADYALYPLLHSSASGSQGNRSFYSNPQVDELLDEARNNMDRQVRLANYQAIQDIIREEMPLIPLYYGMTNIARNSQVAGINMSADGRHNMHNLQVK